MNAHELAYKLGNAMGVDYTLLEESAIMLRQQATELDKVIPQLFKANGIIENLRIRVAELEKDLNIYRLEVIADRFMQDKRLMETPQTKPLSDEEIGQIWKDCMESPYMQISNPVGFARAILRKEQEK